MYPSSSLQGKLSESRKLVFLLLYVPKIKHNPRHVQLLNKHLSSDWMKDSDLGAYLLWSVVLLLHSWNLSFWFSLLILFLIFDLTFVRLWAKTWTSNDKSMSQYISRGHAKMRTCMSKGTERGKGFNGVHWKLLWSPQWSYSSELFCLWDREPNQLLWAKPNKQFLTENLFLLQENLRVCWLQALVYPDDQRMLSETHFLNPSLNP